MKINYRLAIYLFMIIGLGSGCKTLTKLVAKPGTQFRVQIKTDEIDKGAVLEKAISVIKNKINSIKLDGDVEKDPSDANTIIVKIYGSPILERYKQFLFTSYQLEFKKTISPPSPNPLQTFSTLDAANKVIMDGQEILPYTDKKDSTAKFVIVDSSVIVSGDDIRDAMTVSRGSNSISFSLKPNGATKFGDWTAHNIGNYLAIVLDKKVQSVAFIKSQISDSGVIDGKFTREEAEDIALGLKSGYLPGTMRILEESPIGK